MSNAVGLRAECIESMVWEWRQSTINLLRLLSGRQLFFMVVNMKHLTFPVVAFISLAVVGCALAFHHTTYNDGFDFPSENVNKIMKGKTTGDELIQMFGGPLEKFEVSENEEEWKYSYSTGTEIVEHGFLTDKEQSTSQHKTLDILLKNGTVTDFTFTDSH